MNDIRNEFMKQFGEKDSVLIMNLSQTCEIVRMGHAVHDEEDLVLV